MATSLWRCFTLEPTCTAGGGLSGTAVWGPVGIVALGPVHTAVSALVGIAVVAPRNTAVVAQSGTAALTLARKPGSKIFFIQVSSFSTWRVVGAQLCLGTV